LVDGELDVEDATVVLHAAADIFLADLGDHGIVGLEIVLDAHDQIAARGKDIGQERVLGVLHGVAMAQDRHRQVNHVGDRLDLAVAANGELDGDRAVGPLGINIGEGPVVDGPFAGGEIGGHPQGANR
jgi:hypothetical protein